MTSYITEFRKLEIGDEFQCGGEFYIRIWEIPKGCPKCEKKKFYNAVLKSDISKGFTFKPKDIVEKL